jgi:hypothetical protein
MMHKDCEKQNNRQRNTDHPQKCAFAETHNRLPCLRWKENAEMANWFPFFLVLA